MIFDDKESRRTTGPFKEGGEVDDGMVMRFVPCLFRMTLACDGFIS